MDRVWWTDWVGLRESSEGVFTIPFSYEGGSDCLLGVIHNTHRYILPQAITLT